MNKLIKLLTVDEEYVFDGKIEDLNEFLKKSSDIKYQHLSPRELKFKPTISLGTGGMGFGIYVRALVSDLDSDRLKINFKTSVRPEHYFFVIIFVLVFIGMISSTITIWQAFLTFGLWIICHVWFQFIYRVQENNLIEKVVKKLRLSAI